MQIQPISIWADGQSHSATDLNLLLVFDNLINEANFYFSLLDANGVKLSDGNLTMQGTDYENWDSSTDINLAAYQWAAAQLSLTLV